MQQFELPSFQSAWHQSKNVVSLKKKSLLLIFSSITISGIRRYVYAHVWYFSCEKKELLLKKWTLEVFVHFRRPYWCTKTAHQNGVSIQSSTKVRETFRQITQKLCARKIFFILVFYNISFSWFSSTGRFPIYFLLRDSENDL